MAATKEWKTFEAANIGWSMSYPPEWYVNAPMEKIVMFSPEDVSDPIALQSKGNVVVVHVQVHEVPDKPMTLEDLAKGQAEMMQSMGAPAPPFENATLGSLAAKKMVVTVPTPVMGPDGRTPVGFTNSVFLQVIALQEKRLVYIVSCNCPADDFDKYKNQISKMLSSFVTGERRINVLLLKPFIWKDHSICLRYPDQWNKQVKAKVSTFTFEESDNDKACVVTLKISVDKKDTSSVDALTEALGSLNLKTNPEPKPFKVGNTDGYRVKWTQGTEKHDRVTVQFNSTLYTIEIYHNLSDSLGGEYEKVFLRVLKSVFLYKDQEVALPSLSDHLSMSLSNKGGVLGALASMDAVVEDDEEDVAVGPPETYTLHCCENLTHKWGILYDIKDFKYHGEMMGAYHFMSTDNSSPTLFSMNSKKVTTDDLKVLGKQLQDEAQAMHPDLKCYGGEEITICGIKGLMQTYSGESQGGEREIVIKQPFIVRKEDMSAIIFSLITVKEKVADFEPKVKKIWDSLYDLV